MFLPAETTDDLVLAIAVRMPWPALARLCRANKAARALFLPAFHARKTAAIDCTAGLIDTVAEELRAHFDRKVLVSTVYIQTTPEGMRCVCARFLHTEWCFVSLTPVADAPCMDIDVSGFHEETHLRVITDSPLTGTALIGDARHEYAAGVVTFLRVEKVIGSSI